MTPTPRRSGPLVAIGMTIAFGAVLAYCGRVATPTLVARAAPDVAAATFDATVGEGPAVSIDPAAPSSEAAVTSPDPLDPLDPLVGTGAGALAATSAATVGASPGPDVTVATGAPRVQGSGSSTSSRPSAPTGSSAPSPGSGASPATDPAAVPGVAGSVTTVAATSTSAVASAAAVPGVSSTAPTSTVAVTSTAPGATPTSTTSSSSTTTTTAPTATTTTTTTAPATTVAPTTTTTPAAVLPPPTTTPAPIAGGAVVDIDFQQGTDAASVGLEALSPGPHGVTTDLAIAGGVARARRLDVEVYARTTDLGSADHWVEADLHIGADIVGNYTGVMTRVSASDAGYAWHKLEVWGTWGGVRLLTLVGSRIADEQYFAFQLRPDTTYRLRLETRGSLISGYVDGRQLFEVTAPAVPWSPTAGINMTASGDPSHTTLDNLRAGRL